MKKNHDGNPGRHEERDSDERRGNTTGRVPSRAEHAAVHRHHAHLRALWEREVTLEEAREHWLANCADRWMEDRFNLSMELQHAEILRYKWIKSESLQKDAGSEAVLEWIEKYAASFREWFEDNHD